MDAIDKLTENEVDILYKKYSSEHFIPSIDLKRLSLRAQLKLCDKYEYFIRKYTQEKKDYELSVSKYHFDKIYKCELLRNILKK